MTRLPFRHSIFFAAMMAASAAFAGADIVKCVDQAGHVTLTDSPCSEGTQTVLVAAPPDGAPAETVAATAAEAALAAEAAPAVEAAPAAVRGLPVERVAVTRAPVRHDTWAGQRQTGPMFSRDVETLKAARLSMQVLDEASATLRQQRLAGLN